MAQKGHNKGHKLVCRQGGRLRPDDPAFRSVAAPHKAVLKSFHDVPTEEEWISRTRA